MKTWLGVGLGVLSLVAAGCAGECESNRDCPSGQFQCLDNRCVLPERMRADVGDIPPFDAGSGPVDTGVGPRDTGTGPVDTGVPRDAGVMPDTGVGPRDTGVGPRDTGVMPDTGVMRDTGVDAGMRDTGVDAGDVGVFTDTEALVKVGVLRVSADGLAVVGEARFVDYTPSGRMLVERMQDGCMVTERGLPMPGAMPAPIDAQRVDISGDRNFRLNRDDAGVFEIQTQGDPEGLIQNGSNVRYSILSTGADGTLNQTTAETDSPAFTQTAVLDPQAITGFNALSLLPQANEGANVAEIYDENRRIVVVCPVDRNTLALPPNIANLYPSGSLVFAEVRSDAETTVEATVRGVGTLPITFRATRGVRYRLRIP